MENPPVVIVGGWVLGRGFAVRMNTIAFITYDPDAVAAHVDFVSELGQTLRVCGEVELGSQDQKVALIPGFTHDHARHLLDVVKIYVMSNRY